MTLLLLLMMMMMMMMMMMKKKKKMMMMMMVMVGDDVAHLCDFGLDGVGQSDLVPKAPLQPLGGHPTGHTCQISQLSQSIAIYLVVGQAI
jgi:hypothetical protein